ncbi:branched-chain amino acid ABC transporter permease [Rhizobium sp. C4]|uniref:branched-chain amino acid ABC transporter permease n=1 Tax=Rhizobium sp. C4 TaxID=1349800 RepID=UPI001E2DA7DB|nr:branched-chain amino acid ABC transporter permease [Rhizobium sp. C4]MCD2174291.1 branched-chain amino acid ABC transporter permease [Rhizobium sp. C4]
MDLTILLFLVQDGVTNGAIYALLGFALVLVFAVTRIIFIPQGEFVAYGALTYAMLQAGHVPGTAYLLPIFALIALLFDLYAERSRITGGFLIRQGIEKIVVPLALLFAARELAGVSTIASLVLTVAIVSALGPHLYRIAFQPLADRSVLVLLIAAVGTHLALTGLGLVFFGAEGLRADALTDFSVDLGPLPVSGQNIAVYAATLLLIAGLYWFFERTVQGKALRATAVNRLGARLVGIRTKGTGKVALALAAGIGAVSGVLLAPMTTIYYDTGFVIGLKGFVAAIIGGLASYPLTAAAAITVGLIESFSSFFASDYKEVIVFTLLIPVLLVRSFTGKHTEDED